MFFKKKIKIFVSFAHLLVAALEQSDRFCSRTAW
jgi:hypothetical protein